MIWTSAKLEKDVPAPPSRQRTFLQIFLANSELEAFLKIVNLEDVKSIITSSKYLLLNTYYLKVGASQQHDVTTVFRVDRKY